MLGGCAYTYIYIHTYTHINVYIYICTLHTLILIQDVEARAAASARSKTIVPILDDIWRWWSYGLGQRVWMETGSRARCRS